MSPLILYKVLEVYDSLYKITTHDINNYLLIILLDSQHSKIGFDNKFSNLVLSSWIKDIWHAFMANKKSCNTNTKYINIYLFINSITQ
jgi:hypothetical protein